MTQLSDYQYAYKNLIFDRTPDGLLTVTLHTDRGPHTHTGEAHTEFAQAFHDVARDPGNELVVLTGAGGYWIEAIDFSTVGDITQPPGWHKILTEARSVLQGLIDIPVPVIAAIPGPATVHGEYAWTADIVLAADTAVFQDDQHLPVGVVPADGVQVLWGYAMGEHRSKYFLITGQSVDAQQALAWGMVQEVLPADQVLERAHQLARELLKLPPLTRRYTRLIFTKNLRRQLLDVPYDMALEGQSIAANPTLVAQMRR